MNNINIKNLIKAVGLGLISWPDFFSLMNKEHMKTEQTRAELMAERDKTTLDYFNFMKETYERNGNIDLLRELIHVASELDVLLMNKLEEIEKNEK